jgi:glycosyltransferase involved in cell wall biosynthesis
VCGDREVPGEEAGGLWLTRFVRKSCPARVHIGMTAYNNEETIHEAVSSIEVQTHQNWRMTLIDAGSSDGTWDICRDLARQDTRIATFRQEQQTPWLLNAQQHLLAADSPFFMLADADDRWSPNWVAANLTVVEERYLEASFGRIEVMSADSSDFEHVAAGRIVKGLDSRSRFLRQVRFSAMPEVLGKANLIYSLWRTTALRDVFPWDLDRLHANRDLLFLARALNRVRIGSTPAATIHRRQGPSALMGMADGLGRRKWTSLAFTLATAVPRTYPREYAENTDGFATQVVVYGTVGTRVLVSGGIRAASSLIRVERQ